MKKKIISLVIAFFAMVFSCAAVFADIVIFDKKNKGNEKDFVEAEFSSIKELEALCKKYPKNNAEVLVKIDDALLTLESSSEMYGKIEEIHKCFKTELDLMKLGPSIYNKKGNVYVFKFTYENGKYSPGYSLIESNVVTFLDLTLTDNDYRSQNYFLNKLANAVNNQQKIEFNSVKEFEKLYKDHKKNSFCIVIPASSRIRNESNLEKLSKLVFDDASKIKKSYMSYFSSNATVVIESYVCETQNSIDTGDVFGLISSIASSAKVSRDIHVYKESESIVLQMEVAILDNERKANEKAGLGKLTNAEVEKERKKNEAGGRGRLTDAEILTAERKANEKAGLGKLTNAEVEKERKANEAAGNGRITNAELVLRYVNQAKAYEQKKQWAFALNSYYDAMALDIDPSFKKEAVERYTALSNAISSGNPGLGKYSVFEMPDEWKNLLIDAEKVAYTFSPYDFCPYNLPSKVREHPYYELVSLDYKNKTASYLFDIAIFKSDKFIKIIDPIAKGYSRIRNSGWTDLPVKWPFYSVSGNYAFSYPEGIKKDSTGNNMLKTGYANFNPFAIYFDGMIQWGQEKYKQYVKDIYSINSVCNSLFEFDFTIVDKNGKQLLKSKRLSLDNIDDLGTGPYCRTVIDGISQEVMDLLANEEVFLKFEGCYLKYGYGEYQSVYAPIAIDRSGNVLGKCEMNGIFCDSTISNDGLSSWKYSSEKYSNFISNLQELKLPIPIPNAEINVEKALKAWRK